MKQENFATRLQKAMAKKGYKQVDLVNKTKIDKTLINKYLANISEPKQDKLEILAQALDTNEVWLMGYDVPMNATNEHNTKIIKINDNLKVYINKEKKITAEDVLEVNKILMEELEKK